MAVGVCVGVALTSILAPIGASANPLEEVAAGPKAAVEGVVNTVAPSGVTSPVVPPVPSPPVSTPQLPVQTPPVSVPPAPAAIPSPPKPPPAVKVPLPSAPKAPKDSAAHAPHGPGPDLGSSSEGKIASPDATSTPAGTTPGSATTEKSSVPPADSARRVNASLRTVSPGIALPHWFTRVWPAVSLGYIGRALVGEAFNVFGLGSLTAPRLIVGLLPAGFQPTAIGSPHFGVLAEEDASKRGEPSGRPSVGPMHSNPETVAFVILVGLTALAVLAFGSEFPVFRRYRRW